MKAVGRPQKWTKMWRSGRKSVGARYIVWKVLLFLFIVTHIHIKSKSYFLFLQHVLPTFIKYKMQTGVWDKSLFVYIRMLIIIHISSRFYNQNIFRVAFCVLHNWVEIALDPYLCLETPKSTWGVYEIYEWCTLHTFLINAQATPQSKGHSTLILRPYYFHHPFYSITISDLHYRHITFIVCVQSYLQTSWLIKQVHPCYHVIL